MIVLTELTKGGLPVFTGGNYSCHLCYSMVLTAQEPRCIRLSPFDPLPIPE